MPGGRAGGHGSSGGRIGGGGGGRSRASSHSSSRGSSRSSGGSRGGSFGGGGGFGGGAPHYGGPRPPMPPRGPRPPRGHYYGGGGYRGGCLSQLAAWVIVFIIFLIVVIGNAAVSSSSASVSLSNRDNKEKVTANITKAEYIYDYVNIFSKTASIKSGLAHFYDKTGIQPTVMTVENIESIDVYLGISGITDWDAIDNILDNMSVSTANQVDNLLKTAADDMYAELFGKDEGHLLFLYVDNIGYYWYTWGNLADEIMDDYSVEILDEKINSAFYDGYYDEIGDVFSDAADIIMKKHVNISSVIRTILIGVVAIIIIAMLIKFWKARKAQKNKEAEDLQKLLETDLKEFGNQEVADLAKKYDDESK